MTPLSRPNSCGVRVLFNRIYIRFWAMSSERNEENNELNNKSAPLNTFEDNARFGNNRMYKVIKIDIEKPETHLDENGNKIRVKILDAQ